MKLSVIQLFVPVSFMLIAACISPAVLPLPNASHDSEAVQPLPRYVFQGHARDKSGYVPYVGVGAYSDSGLVHGASTEADGSYRFILSGPKAKKIKWFRVAQAGWDTLIQVFDLSHLRESPVVIDFFLTAQPQKNIRIVHAPPGLSSMPVSGISKSNSGTEGRGMESKVPFPHYTFKGHIHSERGGDASFITVAVLGDTGFVHIVQATIEGRYQFTLSGHDASRIRRYVIYDRDYDTLTQNFDRYLLRHQIIINDFKVNLPPPKYHIIDGFDSRHRSVMEPDTVWIDENGRRLPAKPKDD